MTHRMQRRSFLVTAATMASSPFAFRRGALRADEPGLAPHLLSEHGCGRATGYAEGARILTLGDRTHVAWLDSVEAGFRARVRTLDRRSGEWSPTYTLGDAYDNHGGPVLTADRAGFLHAVYYPHHHPFRYRRSRRPNDASEWGEVEQVGERLTYPTLLCNQDDSLLLTGRQSGDGPWHVNLYRRPVDGAWTEPTATRQPCHHRASVRVARESTTGC